MLKPRLVCSLILAATLAGPALAGTLTRPGVTHPVVGTALRTGNGPQLDRPQLTMTSGTSRTFALRAWVIAAFRAGLGLGLVDGPTLGGGYEVWLQDGPDPIGQRQKNSFPDSTPLPGSGG